jgi:hypothetical protein
MFGKPQWFRPKTSWQGWVYTGSWSAAIAMPILAFIWRHQPAEAGLWLALSTGALVFDVWQMRRAMFAPAKTTSTQLAGAASAKNDDGVLYILDSQPGQQAATRNYNLHVRG